MFYTYEIHSVKHLALHKYVLCTGSLLISMIKHTIPDTNLY